MTMPRLFIGIGLPQSYQDLVRPFTDTLSTNLSSKVSWTKPGNWHLTLKFLGDTEESAVPAISEALAAIDLPAFVMQAGGAGVFPNLKRPRVAWLSLEQGAQECVILAQAVEDALYPLGIERENRTFRPHLTLGRIKRLARDDWKAALDKAGKRPWPEFTVDRFFLWKSDLKPTGAVHTIVEEFRMGVAEE